MFVLSHPMLKRVMDEAPIVLRFAAGKAGSFDFVQDDVTEWVYAAQFRGGTLIPRRGKSGRGAIGMVSN